MNNVGAAAAEWYCARCGVRTTSSGACARDGEALRARDGILGSSVGNYTLVARLGEGGMGEVLRAINPEIGIEVAIKVLRTVSSRSKEDAARFVHEASAANRIDDDRIVAITDGGRMETGQPYLVMELLDGESLAAAIARGPIERARALAIVDDVLGAVAAAHAARIVHRDLKPENVFLTASGRVRLLDFGVAKLLDQAESVTRTGAMIGTPHYMAPEQIQGLEIDERTDVYAIGVVLYQLLAGVRPFDGPTPFAIVQAHVSQPVPRLPDDVPAPLAAVVERALAKRPQDRFATADAMRAALREASDPGAAPLRRRRRWWPIVLAGAVLAGALSLGGMCWRGRGHERSPDEVVAAVPPVLDAVAAPVDASIEEPPVADAAVAVIDARVDAPPELARRRLPAKQCACIPTDSARMGESTTSSLCGSRQSPSCRCVEDGEGYGLCVEPWAPCDAAGCPEGQDKLDDVYCPRSRSRGAQGAACTGFRNPTAPLASGTFECACPDSAHFYRGQPGDACRGFDGVSGRARRGKLTDCE